MKGLLTSRERARWRKNGYHVGHCWKCGKEFAYMRKTYLPARKEHRVICPMCRDKMGLK